MATFSLVLIFTQVHIVMQRSF